MTARHDRIEEITTRLNAAYEDGVQAERERLRAAVEGLPTWDKRSVPGGFHVSRSAVLALLADQPGRSEP
jgi:hypothetical protein